MITQQKHEGFRKARLNDAAQRRSVDVDSCLTSRIVVAELQCLRATKGVAKHTHARHVEATRERA